MAESKIETKRENYKEASIVQKHIDNSQSTHARAVENPIWAFLLKLHERYKSKPGELKEDSITSFKKYLDDKYSLKDDKNKAILAAFQHLKNVLAQPVNVFDVVPKALLSKIETESQPKTAEAFGDKSEIVIPLASVFSLIYQATIDQTCFPSSSSVENRLLTLCNTIQTLHQIKPSICHAGVRNDLAHTLNLTFIFPDSETPVLFLDDINSAILSLIKQKARHFLKVFRKEANTLYHALMLEWIKTEETPLSIIDLLNAKVPEKSQSTILRDYVEEQLKVFEFDPADYKPKLESFLSTESLKCLEIPVESGELYYAVRDIFSQPKNVGDQFRDQALDRFRSEAETRLKDPVTAEMEKLFIQELQQFFQVDKAFVLSQNYRSKLITQSDLEVDALEKMCRDFYQKYAADSRSARESKREYQAEQDNPLEKVSNFITKTNKFLRDAHIPWIENFFAMYHSASNDLSVQNKLYAQWFSLYELGKVEATDEWLEKICQRSEQSEAGIIVSMGPYEVNRVVMHALFTSPKKWSVLFAEMFALVLKQLNGEEFEGSLTRQFRDNSYPEDFRVQLGFIKALRDQHSLGTETKSTQAQEDVSYPVGKLPVFPMLYWAKDHSAIVFILSKSFKLAPDQHARVIESIGGIKQIQANISDGNQLVSILGYWNFEQRGNFLTSLDRSWFQEIVQNTNQLYTISRFLNPEHQETFLALLGSARLQIIIENGMLLQSTLRGLNMQQRGHLLTLLGADHLKLIITNGDQFHLILDCLNVEHLGNLLTMLGCEWFKGIIQNADHFNLVLTWLKPGQHGNLLTLLGSEYLRIIIKDANQFKAILEHVNAEQYGNFLTLLGGEHLRIIIQDANQFSSIIWYLGPEQQGTLLTLFGGNNLRKITKENYQLGLILERLHQVQRGIFLTLLDTERLKEILPRGDLNKLFWLFGYLDPERRGDLLIMLGNEWLQAIINDHYELVSILHCVDAQRQEYLLALLGAERLQVLIPDGHGILIVLECLTPERQENFFMLLGAERLHAILSNGFELGWALQGLNPERQRNLLKLLGSERLQAIVQNGDQLAFIFEHLSKEQYDHFLPFYKKHVTSILSDQYAFEFGRWRGHCGRMDGLKQQINSRESIAKIRDLLHKELKAYKSQLPDQNKSGWSMSGITAFQFFKPGNSAKETESRYYQAVNKAVSFNA